MPEEILRVLIEFLDSGDSDTVIDLGMQFYENEISLKDIQKYFQKTCLFSQIKEDYLEAERFDKEED